MRSLTGVTKTEKNKETTTPINILRISFGGAIGSKYYADRDLTSPISAEGRVIDWGGIDLAIAEEKGSMGSFSVTLVDADKVLLGYVRQIPFQNKSVYIYQCFEGLAWGDSILLLKGKIRDINWKENPPSLTLNVSDVQSYYEKKLGTRVTKEDFPNIKKEDDGKIIPLVYGWAEKGETVQIVDAPSTTLAVDINAIAVETAVTDARDFPQGTYINIFLGTELIKGMFTGNKLTISQRGKVVLTGHTSHASPTLNTFRANLSPQGPSWVGYTVRFALSPGSYGIWSDNHIITRFTSPDIYGFTNAFYYNGGAIPSGTYFEIYAPADTHISGEAVYEKISEYIWIINDTASEEVERIEIEASVIVAHDGVSDKVKNQITWVSLDPSYYTIDLNDNNFVAELGHNVTTVTMPFNPTRLSNNPYVGGIRPKIFGIDKENPIKIIVDLAEKIGMSYPGDFDTVSKVAVEADVDWIEMGFSIQETREGLSLIYDIAFQARVGIYWEQGLLHFKYLENKAGTPIATVDGDDRILDTLRISEQPIKDIINKITASWLEEGVTTTLTVEDTVSISSFGEKRRDITLWAHNKRATVVAIAAFWLRRWANVTEIASFLTYLTTVQAERYDWINLNFAGFYSSQPAEILSVHHTPGSGDKEEMDEIAYKVRVPIYAGCSSNCELYEETGCASVCQQACRSGCETWCEYVCRTSCQESCMIICVTGCELDCTLAIQACGGSCQATCENRCQSFCETSCKASGCQGASCTTGCTYGCQVTGCQVACEPSCEVGCEWGCEVSCISACTFGYETGCLTSCETGCQGFCMTNCEVGSCMSGCTVCEELIACITSCIAYCMTAATTGCGGYCTVGCECFCQAYCKASCMTGSCMTNCQCQCQTNTEPLPCSSSTESCYYSCQGWTQTGCNTGCQTGCQSYCMTGGCQIGCEIWCVVGCMCHCEITCKVSCRSNACQTYCECACMTNGLESPHIGCASAGCQGHCMVSGEALFDKCRTSCQVAGGCTAACRAHCQTGCTSGGCQTGCQSYCMTGGCEIGCEVFCQTGCMCQCQRTCECACRSESCRFQCQCLCMTNCETGTEPY